MCIFHTFAAQLSGGQKQRIAIARSILKRPSILLLDESTSSLDSECERAVLAALDKLLESSDMTTIVVAHRLSTIKNADVIAVIEEGRVVEQGSHSELLARNGKYKQLVEAQSEAPTEKDATSDNKSQDKVEVNVDGTSNGELGENEVLVGNTCSDSLEGEPTYMEMNQSSHLVFRDVYFSYPTRNQNMVFKGLNLNVRRGETLAVVGASGAGKSTIASLIERFYDTTSGTITLDGVDLKEMNVEYLRNQLGFVQQEPTLFDTTIEENIRYGYPQASPKRR
jgi:ATP-binding cassette subfamily B (MDR/TAP) protein 1